MSAAAAQDSAAHPEDYGGWRDRQAARRARRGVSSYGFPRSADGERPYVRLGRDRLRSRPRIALERVAMMNGESRNCLQRSMIEKVHAIVRNVH